ncbi:MAG: SAM-dependent DNA methyltransferase [Candidatus Cloacimonetes bacterium]|nr:SAM-dependent DNA methyltransferase [Candidatus Cloacimonadota bacterium]
MQNIKTNERELSSKIAQWFNEQIKRGKYPFTSASCEPGIKVDKTTYFGDIIIWENREIDKAFSYIELKPPFGKTENIERFRKKAVQLKVKIAYTWDFQSLNAYEIKDNKIKLEDSESRSVLTNIEDWKRGDKQAYIKAFISRICDELLNFSEKGKFQKFTPEKHYFIRFLRNVVDDLIPLFEQFIRVFHKQKEYKDIINKYVAEQGIAYPNNEDFYRLIASQRVYGLITKIIFYLTIKRHFKELPDLYTEDEKDLKENLKYAFSQAQEIDWQAVFEIDPIEDLGIPTEAYFSLNDLFSHLKIYNFGALPEDVIGELFEEIIDPKRRHELGQYFTREDLVDLIIAIIVNDKDKIYADPTCGSGTFLIRLYNRLQFLSGNRMKHEEVLDRIWGIDIGKFPAELSTINLFRQSPSNFENFPRVLKNDIFNIFTSMEVEFPPNNINYNQKYNKIKIQIPEFYGLVGNFPYIRQELIEKNVKGYKQTLTKLLAYEYLANYPKLFKINHINDKQYENFLNQTETEKKKTINHWLKNKFVELKLSGQADIYTYIFIHTATLLSKAGSFGIITSNSWLDVAYGSVLKKFFLDHFKIKMIVASWAEPWFDDAAVNTVFTVLEKCEEVEERDKNIVHFVKLKKKLEELIPERNLKIESNNRWRRIDGIVNTIGSAQYKAEKIDEKISSFENEQMRVRLIEQKELFKEIKKQNEFSKWGKYLRAPDVYFEILEKCKDKLVPLKSVADVRFGIKTGVNEFFYLKPIEEDKKEKTILCENSRGWKGKIESQYLKQVIKSPKESDSIIIDPKKLKNFIFICNKNKSELKKTNHLNALKYIEWGETQRTKENKPWSEVPSVQGRKYWWGIETKEFSRFLWPKAFNDKYIIYNNDRFFAADRFYEIVPKEKTQQNLALNHTLQNLFIEVNGRINLGDGVLDNMTYEAEECPIIKDLEINKIEKLFERKVKSISEEVKLKDRQELDKAVLEALDLKPEEYLSRIYEGLTEMVKERLELPKMRKKRKQQKIKISYEEVKNSVIKEIIGDKLKKFPKDFFTQAKLGHDYSSVETEIYNTSGKELHIDEFMHICTLKDEDEEEIFSTKNLSEALFAVILAKQGVHRLKIPKDEKITKSILDNYKNYVNQLKEQLEANAQQKLHNWNEAEQMAKEILEEYGLLI